MIACRKAVEIQEAEGYVSGPKQRGTFGASYLCSVFLKLGIITRKPAGLLSSDNITEAEINPSDIGVSIFISGNIGDYKIHEYDV